MDEIKLYAWAAHDHETAIGDYIYILKFNKAQKFYYRTDIESHSAANVILQGIINALKQLKRPCIVTVCTGGAWGYSSIHNKLGKMKNIIHAKYNQEEKQDIADCCVNNGHILRKYEDPQLNKALREKLKQCIQGDIEATMILD